MKSAFLFLSILLFSASQVQAANPHPPANETQVTVVTHAGYFPVLIRLHNGTLMTVFRAGAPHIGIKGRLDISTSSDGGKTWSAPRTVVDSPEDDRNPALGQLDNGDIILSYAILSGYDSTGLKFGGYKEADEKSDGVYTVRSSDNGKTWTKPNRSESTHAIQEKGNGMISPYGKIVQLPDHTALMSVYYEFPKPRGAEEYVFRSRDGGKTWNDPSLIAKHFNETGLLVLPDGKILAALRSENGGHVSISISSDNGHTWSTPVQETRDLEHPGDLIRLKNGDVLVTYGERNKPYGVHARISHDNGKTWDKKDTIVLVDDTVSQDCGYPSSIQLPNGTIVTAYYRVDDPANAPASTKAKAILWSLPKN
ncbi:MAG: sialidase family protein [Acidobacteriaceae bacterium]